MNASAEQISAVENTVLNFAEKDEYINSFLTRYPHDADDLIYLVASSPKNATLFEILDMGIKEHGHYSYDEIEIYFVAKLSTIRMNRQEVIASSKNLMNSFGDVSDWRNGYQAAIAEIVIERGMAKKYGDTHYGWVDYDLHMKYSKNGGYKVAAIFNVKEDYWGEFEGTFVTEPVSRHHGYTIDVLLEDGTQTSIRYEDKAEEIMKEILTRK